MMLLPKCLRKHLLEYLDHNTKLTMRLVSKDFLSLVEFKKLPPYVEMSIANKIPDNRMLESLQTFNYVAFKGMGDISFHTFKKLDSLYILCESVDNIINLPTTLKTLVIINKCNTIDLKNIQLETLHISDSKITNLPNSLTDLRATALSYPLDLLTLTNLKTLNITETEVINIPNTVTTLVCDDIPLPPLSLITLKTKGNKIFPTLKNLMTHQPTELISNLKFLETLELRNTIFDYDLPQSVRHLTLLHTTVHRITAPLDRITILNNCQITCPLPETITSIRCLDYKYDLPNVVYIKCIKHELIPPSCLYLNTVICSGIHYTNIKKLKTASVIGELPPTIEILKFLPMFNDAEMIPLDLSYFNIKKLSVYEGNITEFPINLESLDLNYKTDISHLVNLKKIRINKHAINSIFPAQKILYKYEKFSSYDLMEIANKIIKRLMRPYFTKYNIKLDALVEDIRILVQLNTTLRRQDIYDFVKKSSEFINECLREED